MEGISECHTRVRSTLQRGICRRWNSKICDYNVWQVRKRYLKDNLIQNLHFFISIFIFQIMPLCDSKWVSQAFVHKKGQANRKFASHRSCPETTYFKGSFTGCLYLGAVPKEESKYSLPIWMGLAERRRSLGATVDPKSYGCSSMPWINKMSVREILQFQVQLYQAPAQMYWVM